MDGLTTLQALGNLLRTHPSIILGPCTPMLSLVLKRLGLDEVQIRLEAADALSGFTFALLSHPPDARKDLVGPLSDSLRSYVGSAFTKFKANPEAHCFVTSVMGKLESGDTVASARGVIRNLIALASVIVIMGPKVFTDKATLTLVFKTLEHPESRKLQSIRLLHALIWCII